MQYIPIHPNELLNVKCTAKLGEDTFDITLICIPICGSNEVKIIEIANNSEGKTTFDVCNEYFDHIVKGYIANGQKIMFKENEKPSDYFNYQIKRWLVDNMYNINQLSNEQKKS